MRKSIRRAITIGAAALPALTFAVFGRLPAVGVQAAAAEMETEEEIEELSDYLTISGKGIYVKDLDHVYVAGDNQIRYTFAGDKGYNAIYSVMKNGSERAVTDEEKISIKGKSGASLTRTCYLACMDGTRQLYRSAEFTVTYIKDSKNPAANIRIDRKTEPTPEFAKKVTFGRFQKNAYQAAMSVSDSGSGIRTWRYYVVKLGSDLDLTGMNADAAVAALEKLDTTVVEPDREKAMDRIGVSEFKKKDGNYAVFVYAEDRVGNAALVGSNGMVVDNVRLDSLILTLSGGDNQSGGEYDGTYYFRSDSVTLTADAKEAADTADANSGVAYITAEIVREGKSGGTKTIYPKNDAEAGKLPTAVPRTLKKLAGKYQEIVRTLTVKKNPKKSEKIRVTVRSQDLAGNEAVSATKKFVIDGVAPKVTLIRKTKGRNGRYYNRDVTFETVVTERFVDIKNCLKYTVTTDKEDGGAPEKSVYTLQELLDGRAPFISAALESSGQSGEKDGRTYKISLTFRADRKHASDAKYRILASVTDRAGNTGKSRSDRFYIDTTAPVVSHTYLRSGEGEEFQAGTKEKPAYVNGTYSAFEAILSVTEKHFYSGDNGGEGSTVSANYTVTAKDGGGTGVELPESAMLVTDPESWVNTGDVWERSRSFQNDAGYSFTFDCTDLAGNQAGFETEYVTLDTLEPVGSVEATGLKNDGGEEIWERLLQTLTFGCYAGKTAQAKLTGSDATAGLKGRYYLLSDTLMTQSELEKAAGWKKYTGTLELKAGRSVVVYGKLVDKAGNTGYVGSDRIILDRTDPSPVITITPTEPSRGKGVYRAEDNPGFDVEATDPENNGSYSGLKEVSYVIRNGTTGAKETGILKTFEPGSHVRTCSGHVKIDPVKFDSNDVSVTVSAEDFSGNKAVSETRKLQIDNEAPKVTVHFDPSGLSGEKYYNMDKTLAITVQEKNFDPSYTPEVTGTRSEVSFSGWTSEGETHTGRVTFAGDGDFSVSFVCCDLAGNRSNTVTMDEITIDKTKPEITVSYDNNEAENAGYYKKFRRATITVKEHNFSASEVNVTVTSSLNGRSVSIPKVSGWSGTGDTHTATICYDGDADYTFGVSVKDLASNESDPYVRQSFTVDQTEPEIQIRNVENGRAYRGTVAPEITVSDRNLDFDSVRVTLSGAGRGEVKTAELAAASRTAQSQTVTFRNFDDDMDDVYTLSVTGADLAGNRVSRTLNFSVNRHGSAYAAGEALRELMDRKYTGDPPDIVITETNVNEVTAAVTLSRNGEVTTLAEGVDYETAAEGSAAGGFTYTYTIFASCFDEEGEYSLEIISRDSAGNTAGNLSKGLGIQFVVDRTSPVMQVSDLEDGAVYNEDSHRFLIHAADNEALTRVEVYLDGVLLKAYEGKELNARNGEIAQEIDTMPRRGILKLMAYDAADNPAAEVSYSVLVTASPLVRFLDTALPAGALLAFPALLFLLLIPVMRRQKEKKHSKTRD